MICQNILEAVGNTPIVRLNRMPEKDSAEILVKVESLNVGGSIKTRTALNMIEQAEKEGLVCGISSGTNVAAALKLAKKLGSGKTVVTVLPDTAERYYSTQLFGE